MKWLPVLALFASSLVGSTHASEACLEAFTPHVRKLKAASRGRTPLRFEIRDTWANKSFPAKVSDFMTTDGKIFLFRTITAPRYLKRLDLDGRDPDNPFADRSVGYSYTLDPNMPLHWSGNGSDTADLILVAVQSVRGDRLTFPGKDSGGELSYTNPVTARTALSEIAFYDEIKIPKRAENVIGVLRKKEFRALMDRLARGNYTIADVAAAVANHAMCIRP